MTGAAWSEGVGYAAAAMTTVSFMPQALKVIRSRRTADLSLPTYAIFAGGVLLWLVFGIVTRSWPVIAANVVTLPLVLVILGMKIRCG